MCLMFSLFSDSFTNTHAFVSTAHLEQILCLPILQQEKIPALSTYGYFRIEPNTAIIDKELNSSVAHIMMVFSFIVIRFPPNVN